MVSGGRRINRHGIIAWWRQLLSGHRNGDRGGRTRGFAGREPPVPVIDQGLGVRGGGHAR